MSFQKWEPEITKYRDCKNFYNNKFRSKILKCNFNYTDLRTLFEKLFLIYSINMHQLKKVCLGQWGNFYDQWVSQRNYEI